MAHGIFIGNSDKSQKVGDIYLGVNGVAQKIKKGYIGVNGVAQQFYPGYVWNRYNANTYYRWNKYNLDVSYRWNKSSVTTQTKLINTWTYNHGDGGEVIEEWGNSVGLVVSSSWTISNGKITITGEYEYCGRRDLRTFSYSEIMIRTNNSINPTLSSSTYFRGVGGSVTLKWSASSDFIYVEPNGGTLGKYSIVSSSGSFIEYVYSDSSNAYPTNGESGGYWYSNRTEEYSRGSLVGSVSSSSSSAYPTNGKQGDYWYSNRTTQHSQGSYIDQVESTESNTYPKNGYQGGYWYVAQF